MCFLALTLGSTERFFFEGRCSQSLCSAGRLYECFETPVELDLKRKKQLNMGKPPVYDRSALLLSTAEIQELKCDISSDFQTTCKPNVLSFETSSGF